MTEQPVSPSTDSNPPIVAAVDGSAVSYHAAVWGAAEAALHGRRLHLINSVNLPVGWGPGAMLTADDMEWMRKDGERILAEAERVVRAALVEPLDISLDVTNDPIIPDLIERSRRASMVVVGSRGLGAVRRGLLGSVSTAVTRHAHGPVAVVHGWSTNDPVAAAKSILVGVDGSESSVPALEFAFEEASRREVGLTALHAWSDVGLGMEVPMVGWDDSIHQSEEVALAESLAGYQERYPDVAVRRILVRDRPVDALMDESGNAQLVVVGSRGRGGFTGMLLGSTSNAVLHSVECPIVVVRHREASS
ncbi:universal stress protein [Nocardia sp. NPDC051570]|uniref:universal stress protein n=1 Tax=Nocardia sp. NPDC051570 TaxID=3364324 RepID=UPI00379F1C51